MALLLGVLLVYCLLPAVLQILLVRWFWRLSKPAAATIGTSPYWVDWLKLIALAAAIGLVAYGWILLFITQFGGLAHGSSPSAEDTHERLVPLIGWVGLMISALLLIVRFGQFRPALSFASGTLLVLAGTCGVWHVALYKEHQQRRWRHESEEHEGTGWQAAAVDSFRKRKYDDVGGRLMESGFTEQTPSFPGGEVALAQAIRQRVRYPAGVAKKNGIVTVEFVVEATGRLSMVHVTHGLGAGYDEEAVRVVRSLPSFLPGCDKGQPVAMAWQANVPFAR